ncbi:MAG TPA: radical SAM protein [Polyangiaceae bacterium]|nr:radical SAM protein [Polyangiaceae bacterium]
MPSATRTPVNALAVELTYSCNQACAYCYNPHRGVAQQPAPVLPSTELIRARLERILDVWELSQVTLTGGEPLRHEGLFALLALLKRHAVPVHLITNGTYITDAIAQELAQHAVSVAQITLNGPNPELHQAHVGRDSFGDAIKGARALVAHGVDVTGCIVVTRRNAEHVAAIIEIWRELGASRIALSRFSPAGVSLTRMKEWLPRRQDLMTAFGQAQPLARSDFPIHCTVPVPSCLFDVTEYAPIQFGQCAIGSAYQELALGPDGALRFCTLHAGRVNGGRDVLDPDWDLTLVPQSPEITNYRQHLPEFCQGCGMASTCLGGCGAAMPYREGAPRALDPLIEQYFFEEPAAVSLRRDRDGEALGVNS